MKMMPPDVISHENKLQHFSEPSIFILDVFRTADHTSTYFCTRKALIIIFHDPTAQNLGVATPQDWRPWKLVYGILQQACT